jgi:methylmalonyl-CoA mutase N-terminal domain/subunit
MQALAAVLGGTQSLHTNGYDEALGLPTEESARIAIRTQQIIAHESGVSASADPLGGSHMIEALTEEIEREVMKRLEAIDARGGMVEAIEQRYPQGEIERSAYEMQRSIEEGNVVVVGVNRFVESEESDTPVLQIDPAIEQGQVAAVRAYRAQREESAVQGALAALREGARGVDNVMPLILQGVRSKCTLGEISDALRDVFGEYSE